MMPQTRAGTRTPAWPGSRGCGLPGTGLATLSPIAIAAHGMWPICTISMARAWCQKVMAFGQSKLPSKQAKMTKAQSEA